MINKVIPFQIFCEVFEKMFGQPIQYGLSINQHNFIDDLDNIELLMKLENALNISIDDTQWEIMSATPIKDLIAENRENKIQEIIN